MDKYYEHIISISEKMETNNKEDSEKKRKILNWTELYNSIQLNIQIASQKLSDIFAEIKIKQNELDIKNLELLKVNEIYGKNQIILNEIQQNRQLLKKEQSKFYLEQEKILSGIEERENNLKKKNFEFDDKIRKSEGQLLELKDQIKNKNSEFVELGIKLNKINNEIISLKKEENKLEKEILESKEYQKNILRDNNSLIKQKVKIETDIFKKQRSLDSFKENKEKMEKDLLRKMKDLQILEGRLRKQFKQIGQDFKL